jgi:hypothetical protein
MRVSFVAFGLTALGVSFAGVAFAQQQDPVVGVQLKSTQWEYIRQVLGKRPHEEVAPLMDDIGGQLTRQYQGLVKNQTDALEKAVRDKIAKEAKEKADADAKANAAAPPPDQPKE